MRRHDKVTHIERANILFEQRIKEEFEGFKPQPKSFTTSEKLRNTAVRDGYMTDNEKTAEYIMVAAKEIAAKYDKLHPEEQKTLRDTYYDMFLKKIEKLPGMRNYRKRRD